MPPISEGVLVRYLSTLEEVLQFDYGIQLDQFYSETSLTPLAEYDPSDRLPMSYSDSFWELALLHTDEMLGMHVGKRVRYTSYASLGHMLITCKSVEDAIRLSCENTAYVGSGTLHIADLKEGLAVTYEPYKLDIPALNCRIDASLLPFSLLANKTAGGIHPKEVWLKRNQPINAAKYEDMFRAPVIFGAEKNGMIWDYKSLKQPMKDANPALNKLLRSHVKKEMENPFTITAQLHEVFENWFAGRLPNSISIETAAQTLGLSVRTLQRKLGEEHTNFRAELTMIRIKNAKKYLTNNELSIAQIAEQLGYSEPAPFVRVFRRETGISPSKYRKQNQKV